MIELFCLEKQMDNYNNKYSYPCFFSHDVYRLYLKKTKIVLLHSLFNFALTSMVKTL